MKIQKFPGHALVADDPTERFADAVTGFLLLSFKTMTDPICPETGAPMKRGVAPMTIACKDQSVTFEMPGWYCDQCGESIHTGDDMKVSDRMLDQLKARQNDQPTAQSAAIAGSTLSAR